MNEKIPIAIEIKNFGMKFDKSINFSSCNEAIKVKLNNRLNIIKIIFYLFFIK
jgi:hypothetical protein